MRRWCSSAALAAALLAGCGPGEPEAPASDAVLAPALVTVARGVHLLGELVPNASYAVETEDGLVLVDTCKEPDAQPIEQQFLALGLDMRRLRLILLTHVHADHSLGAETLRRTTGARIYAGKGDAAVLRAGAPREAYFSIHSVYDPNEQPHPTTVDVELSGGEAIEIGGSTFRAIACPGHTPGCICYSLERDGETLLFTGDVVHSLTDEAQGTGLGTYQAHISSRYRGNAKDYLATLKMLLAMPAPDLVLPGHPRNDPVPQSPRLPTAKWKSMLEKGVAEMETVIARHEEDGADFLDGIAKELLPGLRYLGNYGGRAMYGIEVLPHQVQSDERNLVLIDAPGGAALPSLVEAACRGLRLGVRPVVAVLLTSADAESTAGLDAMVAAHRCVVYAPRGTVDAVRSSLPAGSDVRPSETLPDESDVRAGAFPIVSVLPMLGRGQDAVAYELRCAGRRVVVGGRHPAKITLETAIELRAAVTDRAAYLRTLESLAGLAPDLWLPAVPIHDQNANLYDDEWARTIEANREALR